MSHEAKVWTALWAVYIIWGSTYLAIAVAVETIPPMLAVSTRFIVAGAIMALVVLGARRHDARSPAGRSLSCVLIGACFPGANAVLFYAEQDVPTGLASLIIASVPLWVVVLRLLLGERMPTRGARRRRRRLRGRRGPAPARRAARRRSASASACVSAVMWSVGLVRLAAADDAGRTRSRRPPGRCSRAAS